MKHEIPIDPDMFLLKMKGKMPFHILPGDRFYQVGDLLVFRERCFSAMEIAKHGMPDVNTGRTYECEITAMVHGEKYGILPTHVLALHQQ